jgi:hypothetical protein
VNAGTRGSGSDTETQKLEEAMKRIGSPLAVAVAVAVISGCGRTPTSPLVDAPASSSLTKPAATSTGIQPTPGPVTPPTTDPNPADAPDAPTATTVNSTTNVNGASGKSLALGHVRLVVPKHAYRGKADITITEPDPTRLEARLAITPADKARFQVPLTLIFDAAACGEDCRMMQVVRFDSAANAWVEIPSSVDAANGTLSASITQLGRFKAVCEAKRVGW